MSLNWKYCFPGWTDWDDKTLPIVRQFVSTHRSVRGKDIDELMLILQNNELGWIRKEGIIKKIEELTGVKVDSLADTITEYGLSIDKNIARCVKLQ